MGIDLVVSTLWAELATWKPSAMKTILDREHWARVGVPRRGPRLTYDDRVEPDDLESSALTSSAVAARSLMELLGSIDGSRADWIEPPPDASASVVEALEGTFVSDVYGDAVDRLRALALGLQARGELDLDASFEDVRAAFASDHRAVGRPSGRFSALLAMGIDTIWVPVPLQSTWSSPGFVIASSVRLVEDLDALPRCLSETDPDVVGDLADVALLIEGIRAALAEAGTTRCVLMTG